ncbi:MAG: winged helix-turn-helix domain-containing protein [Myxococcota bacterium]
MKVVVGGREVDLDTGAVDGASAVLRPKERAVLAYLVTHADRRVTAEELLVEVFGYSVRARSRTPYSTVSRLRATLNGLPELVHRRGYGYLLTLSGAPAAPSGSIPFDADGFFGRTEILDQLDQALGAVVTLVGAGGVGKSRIAREWVRRVASGFPGGGWFAELDALGEAGGPSEALFRCLGRRSGADPDGEVLAALASLSPAVIVLDGCERHVEAAHRLVRASPPHHRWVATSQRPLGLRGEVVLPVTGLPTGGDGAEPGAAQSLFVARARAAGFRGVLDRDAVARLVEDLDGQPLSLEIAAAHVPYLPLDVIVPRVEDGTLALASLDRPRRHHRVHTAIDWAVEGLPPSARTALTDVVIEDNRAPAAAALRCEFGQDDRPCAVTVTTSRIARNIGSTSGAVELRGGELGVIDSDLGEGSDDNAPSDVSFAGASYGYGAHETFTCVDGVCVR